LSKIERSIHTLAYRIRVAGRGSQLRTFAREADTQLACTV
jgi:hypothetical protein